MDSEFLEAAVHVAEEVGELLVAMLPQAREAKGITTKRNPYDLVTRADRAAEDLIVSYLRQRFPEHSILAEEGGAREGNEFRWIIDPLDGTTNFAHGVPLFAVSIGLEHRGRIVTGVVHHPSLGEMFVAERGTGAFLRKDSENQRLRVSDVQSVSESVVATGLPYDIVEKGTNVSQIVRLCRTAREVRILGAAALHLAYVAAGRLEGFWEQNLNPWDVAAGVLLVEEAGGRVTHLRGEPFQIDGRHVLATNARIHDEMLELLGN